MDPAYNPYNPGAGAPPPELAGRDPLIKRAETALERIKRKRPTKSLIMLGLRGVGKTVLLNRIEELAEASGAQTAMFEADPEKSLPAQLAPQLHRLLLRLDRIKRVGHELSNAFGTLRAFATAFTAKVGDLEFAIGGGQATGDLAIDLTDLFVAIGEAAQKRDTAAVILVDEVQYVTKSDLSALIVALHKISQRQLPLILFGAGLPQLAKLAGDAKSYAERLFDYPDIGRLDEDAARLALVEPARREDVAFDDDALAFILEETERYPFFLQVWGSKCWETAERTPITLKDAQAATKAAIASLDESIFNVRLARLSERQKEYARAMAEFGAGPCSSAEVAKALGATQSQVAPYRDDLIQKGMAYAPERGQIAFTVPKFDAFMRRRAPMPSPKPPSGPRVRRVKS
ncbi:MAG: ATP-binding protein [Hyphomonadaceae bacterium]|nr:ATP-binding protein [Hyphomonadaceae bacterium]